ncbi:MAG TPA: DUF6249 domain-containing protein, partial [Verrucomicrobiota bacterium]|nr:DUF6249 domain-containing protein [Verrucomicrobiota bacterium]
MNTAFLSRSARSLRLGLLSALLAAARVPAADALTNAAPAAVVPDEPLIVKAMALAIPLAAIVLGIGLVFLMVWTEYAKRRAAIEACHRERLAALEKGLEPPAFPASLWQSDDEAKKPVNSGLMSGLVLVAIGAGLAVFFSTSGSRFHPSVGAIPGALGAAFLRTTIDTPGTDV